MALPFCDRPVIVFNGKSTTPYGEFSPSSAFPVVYRNQTYPTGQHLFQALKFIENYPDIAEHIRSCSNRPYWAFKLAHEYYSHYVRSDWPSMDVMLWNKFHQHPYLASLLAQTGNATLVYESDQSRFWGTGPYQDGRNELGKALELLRDTLRTHFCPGGCLHDGTPHMGSRKWIMPPTPETERSSSSFWPRRKILFYDKHQPYFNFTNFSPYQVEYKGKIYPTSEHLFQAMKFMDHRPDIAERIRTISHRPSVALSESRRFQSQARYDWRSINIQKMEEVLWLKFTQHANLRRELLSTGDAELIEDTDKDRFWGIGAKRDGRNELGKALERLRTQLSSSWGLNNPLLFANPNPWIHSTNPRPRQRILFYDKHQPYFNFSNFSPHAVEYRGKIYPTSEHLFQAMKFIDHRPDIAERIRTVSNRPSVALSESRRFQSHVRYDWRSINIQKMDEVLWLKFTQHPALRAELLSTRNAELVEDSDQDSFWGIGVRRDGRNELGKALERLRASLG